MDFCLGYVFICVYMYIFNMKALSQASLILNQPWVMNNVCLGGHLLNDDILKIICIYFSNRLLTKPSLVLRINLTMVVTRCSLNISGLMIFFRVFPPL